ncbi:MAG: hypothetical protein ACRDBM_08895 [Sporomusa sp.]
MALQYKCLDNQTKDYYFDIDDLNNKGNVQFTGHEFNVLYQINPNVSAFGGYTRSTGKVNWAGNNDGSIYAGNKKRFQRWLSGRNYRTIISRGKGKSALVAAAIATATDALQMGELAWWGVIAFCFLRINP